MADIAYIRVSSVDQNTDRQLDGLTFDETFTEKASAATTKRPELENCLRYVRKGDTLHVHSIDRLARNLKDLERLVEKLTNKGVTVHFHKEHLIFTSEENPTQKLMFQIIGAVAQFERSIIKERQREGIAKAQAKGKHCGRKSKLTLEQVDDIKARIDKGEEKKSLAQEYGISRQTLYRVIKK